MSECAHALREFCTCLPRRPPVYVAPHVEMRGPGERLPAWRCQCARPDGRPLLRNHRHREPWQCLSEQDVQLFVENNPGAPPRKHLAWLWIYFS